MRTILYTPETNEKQSTKPIEDELEIEKSLYDVPEDSFVAEAISVDVPVEPSVEKFTTAQNYEIFEDTPDRSEEMVGDVVGNDRIGIDDNSCNVELHGLVLKKLGIHMYGDDKFVDYQSIYGETMKKVEKQGSEYGCGYDGKKWEGGR